MTQKEFDQKMLEIAFQYRDKKITSREALEQRRDIYQRYLKEGGKKCKKRI